MPARHVMQLRTSGLSAVIGINRAHNVVDRSGEGITAAVPVNDWIMPSGNTLNVLLAPAEGDEAPESPPDVDVHVFVAAPDSQYNEPQTTLARFAWPLPEPAALPHLVSIPFAVAEPPPCSLWTDAPEVGTITDVDRGEIVALVERFRTALEHRDADQAFRLMEYRFRDSARAHGDDYDTLAAAVRDLYQDVFDNPVLRCEPMTPANAVFSIVGGGKVVLVSRGLGRDALRVEAGQAPHRDFFGFQIHVTRIEGRWTIVR